MHPLIFVFPLALVAVGGYLWFRSRKKDDAGRKKGDVGRKKDDAGRKKGDPNRKKDDVAGKKAGGALAIFGIAVTLLLAAVEYGITFALAIAAGAAVIAIVLRRYL